jgi:glycosyltransferase involved in cell wall biosynthesis
MTAESKTHESNALFSVIIPVYNKMTYIRDTFESVLHQKYRSWEIIAIDDGSTDGSRHILEEYRRNYPDRIKVLDHEKKKHEGVVKAMNLGLQVAQGCIISFLDADDKWMPGKLCHDNEIFSKNPNVEAIISHSLYWWPDGSERARVDYLGDDLDTPLSPGFMFEKMYNGVSRNELPHPGGGIEFPVPCGVSIRKSSICSLSPFDPAFRIGQDVRFLLEMYLKLTVYISSCCLSEYRRTYDSAWSTSMREGSEIIHLNHLSCWIDGIRIGRSISKQPEDIAVRQGDIHSLQGEIQSLKHGIDVRDARIASIYRSLSWKLTSPLRMVDRWLRRYH